MNWFVNLKLSQKLSLGFGTILILFVIQGGFSYLVSKKLGSLSTNIYHENLIPIKSIGKINPLLSQYRWSLLLLIEELDSDIILDEIEQLQEQNEEISEALNNFKENSAESLKVKLKAEMELFTTEWNKILENVEALKRLVAQETFEDQEGYDLILAGKESLDKVIAANEELAIKLEKEAKVSFLETTQTIEESNVNLISFVVFGIIVGLLAATFISKQITHPVSRLMSIIKEIISGKLDTEVDIIRKDEIGSLAQSFDTMRVSIKNKIQSLAELNSVIEKHNKELEQKVKERTREIQEILNAIQQGIITMNPDFTVNKEHSLQAESIFRTYEFEGKKIFDLMQMDEPEAKTFRQWFEILNKPKQMKRWQKYVELAPAELKLADSHGTKTIRFKYQPMIKENKIEKLMILAEDITLVKAMEEERAREKILHERQMKTIIAMVTIEKETLNNFLEQAHKVLDSLERCNVTDLKDRYFEIFRDVHTVKGNSGTLGFESLSKHIDDIETFLSDHQSVILEDPEEFNRVDWNYLSEKALEEYNYVSETRKSLFPTYKDSGFFVSSKQLQSFIKALSAKPELNKEDVISDIMNLNSERIVNLTEKYKRLVDNLGKRFEKDINPLKINDPDIYVHRDLFKFFDDSLVHVIRNAVDHGIEGDDERQNAEKGPGTISISYLEKNQYCGIEIRDDGKGIDPEKVAQKALEKGVIQEDELNKMNESEKMHLIFHPGFSLAEKVSEISGRGVGMDAVKNYLEENGGFVELDSKLGQYTSIVLWLPEDIHIKNVA